MLRLAKPESKKEMSLKKKKKANNNISLNNKHLTERNSFYHNYNSSKDKNSRIQHKIVKKAEKLFKSDKEDKAQEILLDYLKEPNKGVTLILVSSEKPNARSKINKEIMSLLNIIETKTYSKSYEMAKDLDKMIREEGYIISQNDLNNFVTKCLINYDIFMMEWNKFKNTHKPGLIKSEAIDEICNYNLDDFFAFKDAVINKNIEKALVLLEDLSMAKCAALPIVVMLANEYRVLYDVKYLSMEEYTNDKISKELDNMHPFRVKNLRVSSNKYSLQEIEKDIYYLADLDYKLVSQDNLGLDEIKKFLLEL